jgi:hypothetical protein
MNEGPPGNPTLKCYGPYCQNEGKRLRRYPGKSLYWKRIAPNFGYRGNNYFCSLRCGMDWAVLKCDAGSDD